MQSPFYISGILYSHKTHQILLLKSEQTDDQPAAWTMLGGNAKADEDAQTAFARLIQESLNIEVKHKNIYPVYDYFHNTLNKTNYVFYAEVGKAPDFQPLAKNTPAWVTFKETLKLGLLSQTKQDVVVSERVIYANVREKSELIEKANLV